MKTPLLSVVVPVFNNVDYVKTCVESILSQRQVIDTEVILVDDGSTDGSERVCDEFKQVNGVRIFHIKNSGVSAARNFGLKKAVGKYVTFVDSDDILLDGFISYMVGLVMDTNVKFGIAKRCVFKKNDLTTELPVVSNKVEKFQKDGAVALLLSKDVIVGCWNKIYDREFLVTNNILFDNNLTYGEGLDFIVRVAKASQKTNVGYGGYYCYRRNNLTSATSTYSDKKLADGEKALLKIKRDVIEKDMPLSSWQWDIHYCNYCINATKETMKRGKLESKEWLEKARKFSSKLILRRNVPFKFRVKMFIISTCPSLLCLKNGKRDYANNKK